MADAADNDTIIFYFLHVNTITTTVNIEHEKSLNGKIFVIFCGFSCPLLDSHAFDGKLSDLCGFFEPNLGTY